MLKLALNKSICASDDEQGINKLWSKQKNLKKFIGSNKIEKNKVKKRKIQKLKPGKYSPPCLTNLRSLCCKQVQKTTTF